jgi:hypothetical protein
MKPRSVFPRAVPVCHMQVRPRSSSRPPLRRRRLDARWLMVVLLALGQTAAGCEEVSGLVVVTADDSMVPEELRTAYRTDAARLTLRGLIERDDPALNEIELPPGEVERYYAALIRVYNLRHRARDAVVETYTIHTSPRPSVHYLDLVLAPPSWAKAWRLGERLTGDPAVDSLVVRYDLRVEFYYDGASFGHLVTVFSPRAINIAALAKRFGVIDGVRYANSQQVIGDGNDIVAERRVGLELEYSVGYGDCLAGCIYRHWWMFQVNDDGSVLFRGSGGDPPP